MRQPRSEPPQRYPALEKYRDDISRCVKCGSCSAVCPTYLRERDESFSARGRMALIKAVLDGRLRISRVFKERLATCTGCLACEASCPSNVPVTGIIQAVKELSVSESGAGAMNSVIAGVVMHPTLFRAAAWLAPLVLHYGQGPGAGGAQERERSTFNIRSSGNASLGTVAFFPGCAISYFQQDIGTAAKAVLNAVGYDVIVPAGLKCCGRPLLSLGKRRSAERLAAHNASVFAGLNVKAVVTACATCGLTFKREYPKLLQPGASVPVVLDIHEFLSGRLKDAALSPVREHVTIHDPCHLGRGQGLSRTVRELLQSIPGITLVEMKNADRCCGFGGVMRIIHRELSDGIVEDKVKNIIDTSQSTVVTGCPGCRMQIADALRRRGSGQEVVHTVQVLEKAVRREERSVRG